MTYRWGRSSTYLHNGWEEAQPKNLHVDFCNFAALLSQPVFFHISFNLEKTLAMAMGAFTEFRGLSLTPSLSGVTGLFLSKCVTHARFVKVAWTLRGIPF